MPVISGGGGGPATGTYLPVADPLGATVDTTTYANPVRAVGPLTALVFPADTPGAAFALRNDVHPEVLLNCVGGDFLYVGDGTVDPYVSGAFLAADSTIGAPFGWQASPINLIAPASIANHAPRINQVSPKFTITAGALLTQQLVSTTGAQIITTRDAETITPVTFNPTAGAAATCVLAISPDNTTYSTVGTETEPAGVALDGTIHLIRVRVPAGWYLKMTVTNAVLGLTTKY